LGAVILLGLGGYFGWTQIRGAQLRAALRQTPTPLPTVAATATPLPATNTPAPPPTIAPASPTATAAAPTATPSPRPAVPTPTTAPTATTAAAASAPPASYGPPVRVIIPDLKIDAPVVQMSWKVVETAAGLQSEWDMDALKGAVGHHLNSASLGAPGNVVISGHNNIYGREFEAISLAWDDAKRQKVDDFTEKNDILTGRAIQLLSADGRKFDYVIQEFYRLRDSGVPLEQRIANGRFMLPTDDSRLTLVTCWPITSNTHRLIVIARPKAQ
jgi:sortase A